MHFHLEKSQLTRDIDGVTDVSGCMFLHPLKIRGLLARVDKSHDVEHIGQHIPFTEHQFSTQVVPISAWYNVKTGTNPGQAGLCVRAALAGGQPVALSIPVFSSFVNAPRTTGLIDAPRAHETFYGAHDVLALGYDATGVWVENQWGTGWGLNGYGHLTWAFVNAEVTSGYTISGVSVAAPAPTATPTATSTPLPPTATARPASTPLPPTSTPVPATSTSTPVPATSTPTNPFAAVPDGCAAGWNCADIAEHWAPGVALATDGTTFRLRASTQSLPEPGDIDHVAVAAQTLNGDGSVSARLIGMSGTSPNARAGLLRQGTAENSGLYAALVAPDGTLVVVARQGTGWVRSVVVTTAHLTLPGLPGGAAAGHALLHRHLCRRQHLDTGERVGHPPDHARRPARRAGRLVLHLAHHQRRGLRTCRHRPDAAGRGRHERWLSRRVHLRGHRARRRHGHSARVVRHAGLRQRR